MLLARPAGDSHRTKIRRQRCDQYTTPQRAMSSIDARAASMQTYDHQA